MKLFGLLSLVAATIGMNLKEPVVNEVIDLVESGLGESKEGRALFITLTLTQSTWYSRFTYFTFIQTLMTTFKGPLSRLFQQISPQSPAVLQQPSPSAPRLGEENH